MEQQYPSGFEAYDSEESLWGGSEAVEALTAPPRIRFIPQGITGEGDAAMLQATLLILPDEGDLNNWPSKMAGHLLGEGKLELRFSTDPDGNQTSSNSGATTKVVKLTHLTALADADKLWFDLLTTQTDRISTTTLALIDAVARIGSTASARQQGCRDRIVAITDRYLRRTASLEPEIPGFGTKAGAADPFGRFRLAGANGGTVAATVTGDGPCYIGSTRSALLESALGTLDAVQLIAGADRPHVVVSTLSEMQPASDDSHPHFGQPDGFPEMHSTLPLTRWSGASDLFLGTPVLESDEFEGRRVATADPNLEFARRLIANRGLAVASNVAAKDNKEWSQASLPDRSAGSGDNPAHPFHRVALDPGPEIRLSGKLSDTIMEARTAQIAKARAAHASRGFKAARSDSVKVSVSNLAGPSHSIEAKVVKLLGTTFNSQKIGFGAVHRVLSNELPKTLKDVEADFQQLVAEHLLAARPDPQPIAHGLQFSTLDDRGNAVPVTARQAHLSLRTKDEVRERRLFGMLSFPTLARVVKLIVDIEFPITALPSDVRAAASTGAARFFVSAGPVCPTVDPCLEEEAHWTACEISEPPPAALSVRLFTPFDLPVPGGDAAHPDHLHGTLHLAQPAGESGRFVISSLDVVSRAEQLVQKAEADANDSKSGIAASEGDLSPRTLGIAIFDTGRADAIAGEIGSGDALRATGGAKKLFAKDLVTGYRVDVAVKSRATHQWTWRSLTRRKRKLADKVGETDLKGLVDASLRLLAGKSKDIEEVRDRLEEASVRPATRVVPASDVELGDESKAAELVAIETLVQWEGDPIGAPCTAGLEYLEPTKVDEAEDLALDYKVYLPTDPAKCPPRMELGRGYRFGLRCTYAGGGGLTLEQAQLVYEGLAGVATSKPGPEEPFIYRRHERIGAPVIAMPHPAPTPGPGDGLDTLIVRSADADMSTPRSRRVLYAPGLPLEQAAMHPHPDISNQRALDRVPVANGRPIGGLVNVKIDPKSGGLAIIENGRVRYASEDRRENPDPPVTGPEGASQPTPDRRPQGPQGVFHLERTTSRILADRRSHYYPDPAVRRLAFQLYTRGETALPLTDDPHFVPIYDADYLQDFPAGSQGSEDSRPCGYPFAMPVLLEIERLAEGGAADPKIPYNLQVDTGYLTASGRFKPIAPRRKPPRGSVTVRRVRLSLLEGTDLELRTWCCCGKGDLDLFARVATARRLLQTAGQADLAKDLAERLLQRPVQEHAEVRSFRVVHAVQRPRPPLWPDAPKLLRKEIAREKWATEAGIDRDIQGWPGEDQIGAGMTWFGGPILVDRPSTGALTLNVEYQDPRDEPGQPLPIKDGKLDFPRRGPFPLSLRLLPAPLPAAANQTIGIVREGLKSDPLFLPSLDSRAYELKITPFATSRFMSELARGESGPDRFTTQGHSTKVWALATRRPDPMAYVELLPAFVWEESVSGPNWVSRRMAVRLRWRRSRLGGTSEEKGRQAAGGWFSSGAGERFALILAPLDSDRKKLGPLVDYISQWGQDPIRESQDRPSWTLPTSAFGGDLQPAPRQWVPMLGEADEEGKPIPRDRGRELNLLTFEPLYDPAEDLWYVDVDIDPDAMPRTPAGGPWMRLGMVRYQPNAIAYKPDAPAADGKWFDLHVSQPDKIEFRLEPSRRVEVKVGRKVDGLWPIDIRVEGPLATVKGGAGNLPDALREQFAAITRPRFKATLLRPPKALADSFNEGGEDIVAVATSDDSPPPAGNLLWETTIITRRDPRRATHFIFLEEVDLMLSARLKGENPEAVAQGEKRDQQIVESGPRFMAKIRVR